MAPADLPASGRAALRWVRSHPIAIGLLALGGSGLLAFLVLIDLPLVVAVALLALVGAGMAVVLFLARRRIRGATPPSAGRVVVGSAVLSTVVVFGLIRLVPYGRDHSNPPVTGEPRWANERTRELMVDACFACHSNEVEYSSTGCAPRPGWRTTTTTDRAGGPPPRSAT